jgi:hypothetical protein
MNNNISEDKYFLIRAEVKTFDDAYFRLRLVAKVVLNNIKQFLTNCIVRKSVFTNKKRNCRQDLTQPV